MSRDEALVAVLNAARVVRKQTPLGDYLPVHVGQCLAQLYATIDAVDAVGDDTVTTTAEFWCLDAECPNTVPRPGAYCATHRPGPDQGRCSVEYCWRQPDLPGGTCYQHSAAAALPSLRRRAPELSGGDDA